MRFLYFTLTIFLFTCIRAQSQTTNGTVSSLVAAENYFGAIVKDKGQRDGFLKVSDASTILFRPGPVKATTFYKEEQDDPGELSWEPSFAKIAKSGDWGFTTGPYTYRDYKSQTDNYGQYLSVWKANNKGVWKLAIDIGAPHPKPVKSEKLNFTDPEIRRFFRQRSAARLKQRVDVILTTDRLFATALKKGSALAYSDFLASSARLVFPGFEPVIGREKITAFLGKENIEIDTEVIDADRAISSDFAYTYGTATVTKNNVVSIYNYVRVWEVQEGFKWNVIVELMSPAR